MKKVELLAPVGDKERLIAAIHFGADAVYFAGKKFGLRAFADNFDENEIIESINYAHKHNVKVYITVNILAHNDDFVGLVDYLKFLDNAKADGVIVSDLGIAHLVKKYTNLELHVSTQANVTNSESAKVWVSLGAKRLVLARELSLKEIKDIKNSVGKDIDIECFAHGAMCISYSGRCLLSNYFRGRDSNKGACAQPCRWSYVLSYKENDENSDYYPIEEDNHGTYILNSKDLCLINYIKELIDSGVTSLKIEGRMKSTYYVATVINAYRRAIDNYYNNVKENFDYIDELKKCSNRDFTTGFYFNSDKKTNILTSRLMQSYDFIGIIKKENINNSVLVEIRNKFKVGDVLEVLSSDDNFNKTIFINDIIDLDGNHLIEAKKVKQLVYIKTDLNLKINDILRRKIDNEIKE